LSTIIRTEPLPMQTRNGKGSQWNDLIEELEHRQFNGDAGLVAEGVDGTRSRTLTSSLRKVFQTRNLPWRAATRKIGDDSFNVYVVSRND